MRILGKRQLGELELSELVVASLMADLASLPLQDIGIPLMNGLVSILILFCCELILVGAALGSVRLRVVLYGRPSMLVENGRINQREMKKCRYTIDELTEELRSKNVMDISTVQYAILETKGVLNVILSPAERPVTAAQMSLQPMNSGYTSIIINNGRVIEKNLRRMGRDEGWLRKELEKQGIGNPRQVYILTLDNAGGVYLAKKDGAL